MMLQKEVWKLSDHKFPNFSYTFLCWEKVFEKIFHTFSPEWFAPTNMIANVIQLIDQTLSHRLKVIAIVKIADPSIEKEVQNFRVFVTDKRPVVIIWSAK